MTKVIPQMEPWFNYQEAEAVYKYMKTGGWVTEFKKTRELEEAICKYTKAKYALMTNNGTVSLILSLLALKLAPNDEVLAPNLTMIATPNAAVILGLKPVLVDVEPSTLCLDLVKAKEALTFRTKAMIYVPFNGRSGNMKKVLEFCRDNHLFLIEDAAQALGSFWEGKHLGTFGDLGSFSFSVPKIITTGQGGAIITNRKKLFNRLKLLKDFGRRNDGNDIHDFWGWNFKFTDLQAVIGIEQMKKLPLRVKRKKEIFAIYKDLLSGVKEIEFIKTDLTATTPWFIDIFVPDPDKLSKYLERQNIGSRRIYPAVSSQKIYKKNCRQKNFPVSKSYAKRGLWLPSSSKLKDQDIKKVARAIRKYYS